MPTATTAAKLLPWIGLAGEGVAEETGAPEVEAGVDANWWSWNGGVTVCVRQRTEEEEELGFAVIV
jgi:hypothetical protein